MKIFSRLVFVPVIMLLNMLHAQAQFQYISPVPGSKYHNPEETIILRNESGINDASLQTKNLFKITGSLSGVHECEIKLAEKNKTIIIRPRSPFTYGETVDVKIGEGIISGTGIKINGTSFNFSIRPLRTQEEEQRIAEQMQQVYEEEFGKQDDVRGPEEEEGGNGMPVFSILNNTNPAEGNVFFHNFSLYNNLDAHYCIIENNGDSVYGKFDSVNYNDFDLNHNGYLTVYNRIDSTFIMLDSNYTKIDEFQMGNGYESDVHEFQIFPGGNHYMLCYDPQIVDMTVYNPGYSPNATVLGCVIQELDENGNVLFQWRSWDHYEITDCEFVNLSFGFIDYVHGNTIEADFDGNILFSSRHFSEITKINRTTGDIIWRLGGENNEFTFINDNEKFYYQHDIRRLPNGHITLYDNGNYHQPPRSWAKEYVLDEVNKTCSLVWKYSRPINATNIYANAMGSMQRLSNGNTLICWGLITNSNAPNITEVDSMGNIVWEMQITLGATTMYRAHRHVWQPCSRPSASGINANKITTNSARIVWTSATNASSYDIQFRRAGKVKWKTKPAVSTIRKLKNLTPNQTYEYRIRSHCTDVPTTESGWTDIKTFTTLPLKELYVEKVAPSFNLYPNPADHLVQLEIEPEAAQAISITFYDMMGRVVLHSEMNVNEGQQLLSFDVSQWASGIYMAEIKTAGGKMVQKFVKE